MVPLRPVAVKLIEVEEPDMFERIASLRMNAEHPDPQLAGPNVEVMLKRTMTERD